MRLKSYCCLTNAEKLTDSEELTDAEEFAGLARQIRQIAHTGLDHDDFLVILNNFAAGVDDVIVAEDPYAHLLLHRIREVLIIFQAAIMGFSHGNLSFIPLLWGKRGAAVQPNVPFVDSKDDNTLR